MICLKIKIVTDKIIENRQALIIENLLAILFQKGMPIIADKKYNPRKLPISSNANK